MTLLSLNTCNVSTPLDPSVSRPDLPPMTEHCAQVPVPERKKGEGLGTFGLRNRNAVYDANDVIGQCQAFYGDIRRDFGNARTR